MTITELLSERGLTIDELAMSIGINADKLSAYAQGKVRPTKRALAAIKKAYGVDVEMPARSTPTKVTAEPADPAEVIAAAMKQLAEVAAIEEAVETAIEEQVAEVAAEEVMETADEEAMETADEEQVAEVAAEEVMETADEEAMETADEEQVAETADEEEAAEAAIEEAMETADEEQVAETADEEEAAEAADEEAMETADEEEAAEAAVEEAVETADEEQVAEAADEEQVAEAAVEEAVETADEEQDAEAAAEEKAARKAAKKARKAAKKQKADEEAARWVAEAIKALGNCVDLNDEDVVIAARHAYDSLTDDQEQLIPGDLINQLLAAEQMLEEASKTFPIRDCWITVKDVPYTGKKIKKLSVKAECGDKKLEEGEDYTLSYDKDARKIGLYMLTLNGQGHFTGSVDVPFYVLPKAKAFIKMMRGDKKAAQYWKCLKHVKGIQIEYGLDERLSDSRKAKIRKTKDIKKLVKKLKPGKKYYVRARLYAKVDDEKHYSAWSKVESLET